MHRSSESSAAAGAVGSGSGSSLAPPPPTSFDLYDGSAAPISLESRRAATAPHGHQAAFQYAGPGRWERIVAWAAAHPREAAALALAAGGLAYALLRWAGVIGAPRVRKGKGGKGRKGGARSRMAAARAARGSSPHDPDASIDANVHDESDQAPVTPVGFRNVGNSCYLNALLQSLSSSGPFLSYLEQLRSMAEQLASLPSPSPSAQPAAFSTGYGSLHSMSSHEFVTSLLQLVGPQQQASSPGSFASSSSSLNPAQFLALLKKEAHGKFQHFNQEDAHELWNVLMDILERKASHTQTRWRDAMQQRQQELQRQQQQTQTDRKGETGAVRQPHMEGLESLLEDAARIVDEKLKQTGAADEEHKSNGGPVDASVRETDSESDSSPAGEPHALHSSGEHAAFSFSSAAASAPVPAVDSSPSSSTAARANGAPSSAASAPTAGPSSVVDPLAFPSDPFLGLQAHFLLCQTCQSPSSAGVRHTPFNSLTLSFPYGAPPAPTKLEEMLSESVRAEIIDSVRCEKCNWNERVKLVQKELRDVSVAGEKGPKSRRYLRLLTRLLEETQARAMLLQPNAGQLLEQRARDYLAKTKGMADESSDAKDGPQPNGVHSASAGANGSTPTAATAAPSPSASPDFLNPRAPYDGLASASSSSSSSDCWSEVSAMVSDTAEGDASLSLLPRRAGNMLRGLVRLDTRRQFSKSIAVSRLPRALCFHLNRLMGHTKLTQFVSFPTTLSMAPYTATWMRDEQCTNMQLSESGGNAANYLKHKHMRMMQRAVGTGAHAAAVASTPEEIAALQLYELDAVVVHQGNAAGGHYVAYRRQVQVVRSSNGQGNGNGSGNGLHAKPSASTSAPVAPAPASLSMPASADTCASSASDAPPSNGGANGSSNGSDSLFSLDASSSPPPAAAAREIVTWWYMSDEARRQVDIDEVMSAQAYLLLYREKNVATR